jgi:hypothetical protein
MRPCGTRAHDSSQCPRESPLAADHLADVVLSDVQTEDDRAVFLGRLDPYGVWLVDQLPRKVLK